MGDSRVATRTIARARAFDATEPSNIEPSRKYPCLEANVRSPSKICGRSSASARRRFRPTAALACAAGHDLRHGEERRPRPSCGCFPTRRRARAAPADRRRQGQRAELVARRQMDRVRRQAQGRRREPQVYLIAPDGGEARRLTSARRPARWRLRWFPDGKRIAFISWVWPDLATDKAQAQAHEGAQGRKVKAHLTERSRVPLLGPLAHRRPRAARVRRGRRDRPRARPARGHRARAAAVGAVGRASTTSARTAASSR